MTTIEETIRGYLSESLLDEQQAATLSSSDDLLMVLDSLQVLRMLMDLEAKYSITVDNSELTPENLGSIERLVAFIEKKQRAAAC